MSCNALRILALVMFPMLLPACSEAPDGPATPTEPESARLDTLYVATEGDRVTVRAQNVTVGELIDKIVQQSHLKLVAHDALEERVTIELDHVRLPEALGRILRHQNFALQYRGRTNNAMRGKLWIFSTSVTEPGPPPDDLSDNFESFVADVRSADPIRRREAVEALGASGTDEAVEPLTLALADDDPDVRIHAVSALANVGTDNAVAAMGAALNDWDTAVREEAVDALGDVGNPRGIPLLQQALRDHDESVRASAIDALARIGGDESALALIGALHDKNASIREDAVDALAEIGGSVAVSLLEQALADDQSNIREAAAESLAELSSD